MSKTKDHIKYDICMLIQTIRKCQNRIIQTNLNKMIVTKATVSDILQKRRKIGTYNYRYILWSQSENIEKIHPSPPTRNRRVFFRPVSLIVCDRK